MEGPSPSQYSKDEAVAAARHIVRQNATSKNAVADVMQILPAYHDRVPSLSWIFPPPSSTIDESSGSGTEIGEEVTAASHNGINTSCGTYSNNVTGCMPKIPNLRVFTFSELKSVTQNFKNGNILGGGGFGLVYKGWVDENTLNPAKSGKGIAVAVKKWKPGSFLGLQEWQSEVNFLRRLSHPNIVKLLGHCREDKELLLVYEFMANGNLADHLYNKGASVQPLSWSQRLKIAIGVAGAVAFLHSSDENIIHRHVKPANVLLDSNFNAKLASFGLAISGPTGGDTYVETTVVGTYGYAGPEYVATGRLHVKTDVYGFGVLLLEMLTGLRVLDNSRPTNQHNLVDWAKPFLTSGKKIARLMDPRLEGKYPSKAAVQVVQLTHKCLARDRNTRPSMAEVLAILQDIEAIET